jgi:hypothetical protein
MDDRLADGIMQVRRGLVRVKPGYDGVYEQKSGPPTKNYLPTQSLLAVLFKRPFKNQAFPGDSFFRITNSALPTFFPCAKVSFISGLVPHASHLIFPSLSPSFLF